MIPQFPDSRDMTIEDKPVLDAILAAEPPQISAYTFTNIFAWREAYGATISRLGEHVLVLCSQNGSLSCLKPLGAGPIRSRRRGDPEKRAAACHVR